MALTFKENNMKNEFVKDFWKKNPELMLQTIKEISNIEDEELAKRIAFQGLDERGCLKFSATHLFNYCNIYVNDFMMEGTEYLDHGSVRHTNIINKNISWMKSMYDIYGDKYVMKYISQRNQKLDNYISKYEEKYNNETQQVLDKIGFDYGKTK